MQSEVYEVAYKSAQNMLVCAPTGAGKTNVAMLTLLQLVSLYYITSIITCSHTVHCDSEGTATYKRASCAAT
jgi:ERCC4-related helicase